MKVIIECDCGNNVVVTVCENKYVQLRDSLYAKSFYVGDERISNGKLIDFKIECTKCKRRIILGVD